jgi:hypothetical protein
MRHRRSRHRSTRRHRRRHSVAIYCLPVSICVCLLLSIVCLSVFVCVCCYLRQADNR